MLRYLLAVATAVFVPIAAAQEPARSAAPRPAAELERLRELVRAANPVHPEAFKPGAPTLAEKLRNATAPSPKCISGSDLKIGS